MKQLRIPFWFVLTGLALMTWMTLLGCPNPTVGGWAVPAAPSNFLATALSSYQIELTWADNSDNEDNFLIERSLSGGEPWSHLSSVAANSESYMDSGLVESTRYFYRICASNGAGSSSTALAYADTDSLGGGGPTYSIVDCWWSDSLDTDGDGYTDYRRLHTNVDVSDGSTRSIDLRVYYKPSSSSSYIVYDTILAFTITGTEADSAWVAVSDLPQDTYDFKVAVYEAGGYETKASRDATLDPELNDQLFEPAATGVIYWVSECWWADAIDKDFDGYTSYRGLTMYINVSSGYPLVKVRISYRPAGASTYTLYGTSPNFSLSEETSAIYQMPINGITGTKLLHDSYDFLVEVLNEGTTVASLGPDDDPDLDEQLFEDSETIYSVADCWWSDAVDLDLNGYTTARTLHTDVDVSDGLTQLVFLKVYYKPTSSSTYTLYDTTSSFSITGVTESDAVEVVVGGSGRPTLPYDAYDFKVEVYEEGDSITWATRSHTNDPELYNELFEDSETPLPHSIVDCWWTDMVDLDGDGYTLSRKLHTEVDLSDGSTRSVYLKIYRKPADFLMYTLYLTTPNYSITGTAADNISVSISDSPSPGSYDFKVEVYEVGDTALKAVRSDVTDGDLDNQLFEPFSSDK